MKPRLAGKSVNITKYSIIDYCRSEDDVNVHYRAIGLDLPSSPDSELVRTQDTPKPRVSHHN